MSTNTPHQLTDGPVEYIPAEDIACYHCEKLDDTCPDCLLDFLDGEPLKDCEHLITAEFRNRQRECVMCGEVTQ